MTHSPHAQGPMLGRDPLSVSRGQAPDLPERFFPCRQRTSGEFLFPADNGPPVDGEKFELSSPREWYQHMARTPPDQVETILRFLLQGVNATPDQMDPQTLKRVAQSIVSSQLPYERGIATPPAIFMHRGGVAVWIFDLLGFPGSRHAAAGEYDI